MSHSLLQPAEFDSFKYGFELPASQQLSRVNAKIGRWDRAQQLISVSKMGEEQRTKKIEDRQRKQFHSFERKRNDLKKIHDH